MKIYYEWRIIWILLLQKITKIFLIEFEYSCNIPREFDLTKYLSYKISNGILIKIYLDEKKFYDNNNIIKHHSYIINLLSFYYLFHNSI